MEQAVKYEGVTIKLGGKEFVVPALTLKQVRSTLKEPLAKMQDQDPNVSMGAGLEVILAALQRNYPEMTMDALEDMIDMRNFKEIIPAVMGVSGMAKKELGE